MPILYSSLTAWFIYLLYNSISYISVFIIELNLYYALQKGDIEGVKSMLEKGADDHDPDLVSC